jgi:nicotinate-nucleotide adenylyltransferase
MPILFFGGTFNPPHTGHVKIISYITSIIKVKNVYVVPSFSPPHKQDPDLASFEDRLEMTRKIFMELSEDEKIIVADMEKNLPSPSYTYQSLEALSKIHPGHPVIPVVGMDMYLNLNQWMNYSQLREKYNFIVLQRLDMESSLIKEGDKILDNPYWNISSREIRNLIREFYINPQNELKKNLEELISPVILKFIIERKLYIV